MNKKISILVYLVWILGTVSYSIDFKGASAASLATNTLILYDATSGNIPGSPLVNFTDFPPGSATPLYSNGLTVLDTTTAGSDTYAGWVSSGATTPGFPILDRSAGFQLNFSIQVDRESHDSHHRAGFSVIVLSQDAKGVELGFWENEIWAQSDEATGGLFRRGEGVAFPTTTAPTDYQITVAGDSYTLTANMNPILSGPLRDYSSFDGFPDPYETPNFIFLGDDTRSAQARVQLRFVSVTGTEPITPTSTSTVVSNTEVPTASSTPLPSVTPVPSPAPVDKTFPLCPSGWIFVVGIITVSPVKKIRAGQ